MQPNPKSQKLPYGQWTILEQALQHTQVTHKKAHNPPFGEQWAALFESIKGLRRPDSSFHFQTAIWPTYCTNTHVCTHTHMYTPQTNALWQKNWQLNLLRSQAANWFFYKAMLSWELVFVNAYSIQEFSVAYSICVYKKSELFFFFFMYFFSYNANFYCLIRVWDYLRYAHIFRSY